MLTVLTAILPIIAALLLGYGIGCILLTDTRNAIAKLITPAIWLLLFSIGHTFGEVLGAGESAMHTVQTALIFATLTTLVPWILIALLLRKRRPRIPHTVSAMEVWSGPVKNCMLALSMVLGGVLASKLNTWHSDLPWPSSNALLYTLLALVGVDLVGVCLHSIRLTAKLFILPALVVIGSLLAGVLAWLLVGGPVSTSLALASGFGWFSLSSILVSSHLGDNYGAIALLTDLFRELFAVVLLYTMGMRFSSACIGASAATALDTTLPIIRQTCHIEDLPLALMSGLLLTLSAPLLMTFFLVSSFTYLG